MTRKLPAESRMRDSTGATCAKLQGAHAPRSPGSIGHRTGRREFLADVGMGFTGLVLGKMLADDGIVRAGDARVWLPPDGQPQITPKAKSVIWIFLVGGMSHMESFDPKPELNKWAGKTIAESPYKAFLDSPYLKKNLREFVKDNHKVFPTIYPLQVGYKKY